MQNLDHMLYENLQFIKYMLENDYDRDIMVDYVNYNINLIKESQKWLTTK